MDLVEGDVDGEPWQSPANVVFESGSGVARSESRVPSANEALQRPTLQSRPIGVDSTRPRPLPPTSTVTANVRGGGGGSAAKVALTCASPESVSTQTMPEHAPPKPAKALPASASAVNTTIAEGTKVAPQSSRQSRPDGAETTRPGPRTWTFKVGGAGTLGVGPVDGGAMEEDVRALPPHAAHTAAAASRKTARFMTPPTGNHAHIRPCRHWPAARLLARRLQRIPPVRANRTPRSGHLSV